MDDGVVERGQWTAEHREGSSFVYVVPAREGRVTVESQRELLSELWGAKTLAVRSRLPNGNVETAVFHLEEFMSTPASSLPGGGLERCAVTESALWDEWEPTDNETSWWRGPCRFPPGSAGILQARRTSAAAGLCSLAPVSAFRP